MDHQLNNIKEQARSNARFLLAKSTSFQELERPEQFNLYKDLVDAEYEKLAVQHGLSFGQNAANTPQNAADKIPGKDAYSNQRIDQAGRLLGEFIREVNFPEFVAELLKGVFDANLDVTIKQMQAYQELLKSASSSLSKFVKDVTKADSLSYLVEQSPDEFSVDFPDGEGGIQGEPVLMDKDGNIIDTEDTRIKPRILDAQIELAKERRALLRETILMGVSRLVVEKGTVKAAVIFDIKASEKMARQDQSSVKNQNTTGERKGGGIFGIFGGSRSSSNRRTTEITVSSAQGITDASLAAKLTGEVEIIFKSDYFKLDNFAQIYGGVSEDERKEGAPKK